MLSKMIVVHREGQGEDKGHAGGGARRNEYILSTERPENKHRDKRNITQGRTNMSTKPTNCKKEMVT